MSASSENGYSEAKANPDPGPSIFHDFDCTHDPCLCGGWLIERAVSCVVCPRCAFTFDASHENTGGGGYSCPNCDDTVGAAQPFHAFDFFGNEFVIEHGNVAIDAPTVATLWPLAMWRAERDRRYSDHG